MANFFRHPDRRQRFLLPIDMMDWLPEDDIVHLIVDAVGVMDLRRFEDSEPRPRALDRRHSRRRWCWRC